MRSRLLMFLLLLSILIHDAQGRKLISKGSITAAADDGIHSLHHEDLQGMKSFDESQSKKWPGSFRKVTVIHVSSTTTNIAKNEKNGEMKGDTKSKSEAVVSKRGRKEENQSVKSSSKTKTQQVQDMLGINEMDYTLARRKPPIHN